MTMGFEGVKRLASSTTHAGTPSKEGVGGLLRPAPCMDHKMLGKAWVSVKTTLLQAIRMICIFPDVARRILLLLCDFLATFLALGDVWPTDWLTGWADAMGFRRLADATPTLP